MKVHVCPVRTGVRHPLNQLPLWLLAIQMISSLCGQSLDSLDGDRLPIQSGESLRLMPTTPRVATAIPVEQPPVIDGEIFNDTAWEGVLPTEGFWQTRPFEGEPSSERTEVRIVYTQDTLYFGVVCYDENPEGIIVSDSRRDSPLDQTDSFQFVLDTYQDRQNGFVFGTNPAGIEYDAQVTSEGQGSTREARQQGGAGGGLNINWDASWQVRTKISEIGWSIEFAIPFRTLRYPRSPTQVWGLNFQRNIRRRNEVAFWSPLSRQFTLMRLSLAGTLEGLEIPNQRNFKVMPYLLGDVRKRGDQQSVRTGEIGLDAKYSLTPSLTLDLTYNTDFAQVEVDDLQINLDRFNLFFPEKRPFFLENAGLFAVGDSGEAELFFSRRIGIGEQGEVIPIFGGARLTGKISGTNIGFLNMQTESLEGMAPANNFTVGRLSRELPNRSSIGAIFINRQGTGDLRPGRDYNRTYGVDGRWGIGKYGEVKGFLAGTTTPELTGDEYGYNIGTRYDSQSWLLTATYTELGENFNPEVGFLTREGGYRKPFVQIFHRYRPANFLGFHELRPHATWRGFFTPDGFQETGKWHLDNHWEWRNGYEIQTALNLTREGVQETFEIFPDVEVPAGTYDHKEAVFDFFSNRGAWLSFQLSGRVGGFFGGDQVSLEPTLRMRIGETFNTELTWKRNDIDLPDGDFVTNLGRLRVSYSFTPRILAQALLQYNDRDDIWSTNFRFSWLQTANIGLFIVYNTTRELGDLRTDMPDRSLIIKFNRLIDLLD